MRGGYYPFFRHPTIAEFISKAKSDFGCTHKKGIEINPSDFAEEPYLIQYLQRMLLGKDEPATAVLPVNVKEDEVMTKEELQSACTLLHLEEMDFLEG